jgi:hypothetical protein
MNSYKIVLTICIVFIIVLDLIILRTLKRANAKMIDNAL